jgi:hypothetical protein
MNLGVLWTGLIIVLFKHLVPQIGSASTLAVRLWNYCEKLIKGKGSIFKNYLPAIG